jgi:hypothetical protein
MRKTVFIADRWVKFVFKGEICIGRTYRAKMTNLEESLNRFVFLITKERKTTTININQCINLKYLEFVAKPPQAKDLKMNTEEFILEILLDLLISSGTSRKTISTLAQKQFKNSSRN